MICPISRDSSSSQKSNVGTKNNYNVESHLANFKFLWFYVEFAIIHCTFKAYDNNHHWMNSKIKWNFLWQNLLSIVLLTMDFFSVANPWFQTFEEEKTCIHSDTTQWDITNKMFYFIPISAFMVRVHQFILPPEPSFRHTEWFVNKINVINAKCPTATKLSRRL